MVYGVWREYEFASVVFPSILHTLYSIPPIQGRPALNSWVPLALGTGSGTGAERSGAKGSIRPAGSRVMGVLKSFNRRKDGSWKIVPDKETARRVSSVSTSPLSAEFPPKLAPSLESIAPGSCEDELYQKNPAKTTARSMRIVLCLKMKVISG